MQSLSKKIIPKLVGIALVLLAAIFAFRQFVYYPAALEQSGSNATTVDFVIERGESLQSVATRLVQAGVIQKDWVLKKYLAQNHLDTKVEAGHFTFAGGETVSEVAQILQAGQVAQISLTILEGWNSADIDAKLFELGLIQAGGFSTFVREGGGTAGNGPDDLFADRPVASLEGYLFPATYKIDPENFSVEGFVARMLTAMENNLAELGFDRKSSPHSLHEILTMASIVELEENSEVNRAKVADILWRRIESGMGLYADSTLFYVLGHRESLFTADFELDSPYNTRINRGLPPTPICSPSRSAIAAALHPESNEFWYYLHDTQGEIHFARTLEEHNENKARYLQ